MLLITFTNERRLYKTPSTNDRLKKESEEQDSHLQAQRREELTLKAQRFLRNDPRHSQFVHDVQHCRLLTTEGVFAMVATTDIVTDKKVICAYTSFYALTFVMIDNNFLYRMFASIFYLYVPTDSGRARLRESALAEKMARLAYAVCSSCAIMVVCFGFMIYAMLYIVHELRVSRIISKKTLRLQRQLFATLCLQGLVIQSCLPAFDCISICLFMLGKFEIVNTPEVEICTHMVRKE
ncbi:hypothetical protein PRIPAC_78288 [Pristionchus pacificus]|uniref:G protein-coupled receptor n=1 Tax=Pristionchus pacificus TaxID=54126 RepID=A0A2A6CLD3_PRIPA|nr:hypothetical protein PRIPAC_78288 [Pristionchus pacificus]|eukprot:PDM78863.1 G protein-coupled receptor [Pristionchus pacificus]